MDNAFDLIDKVSLIDSLSQETEFKEPNIQEEAEAIENIDQLTEEDKKASTAATTEASPEKKGASPEKSAELLVSGVDAILTLMGKFLNAKASKKLTAEEWFLKSEIESKPIEDRTDPEKKLLIKAFNLEKKLEEAKEEMEMDQKEEERLTYFATLLAEEEGWAATAKQGFYLEIIKIIGFKVFDLYSF